MAKHKKVRFDIEHSLLKHLYIDEGYSLRKLQGVFHISGEHLRATLEYLNLKPYMRNKENDYKPIHKVLTDYKVGFNKVKKAYMWGAKSRDLDFTLTDDEFNSLIADNCYYCGIKPNQHYTIKERDNFEFYYNGVDRVDNSLGYNSDNVVTCCKTCNLAKQTMSKDEFYDWINRVYHHTQGGEKTA